MAFQIVMEARLKTVLLATLEKEPEFWGEIKDLQTVQVNSMEIHDLKE